MKIYKITEASEYLGVSINKVTMSAHHDRLIEEASLAINTLFSDLSVPHEQILESLELLHDEMHILIEATGEEIERGLNFQS